MPWQYIRTGNAISPRHLLETTCSRLTFGGVWNEERVERYTDFGHDTDLEIRMLSLEKYVKLYLLSSLQLESLKVI